MIYKVDILQFCLAKHKTPFHGEVSDWYADLSATVRAEFDDVLGRLAKLDAKKWDRPDYAYLSDGVSEIRFTADRVKYRPLGFFLPRNLRKDDSREEFVILIGASKKMELWRPFNARETAIKRRKLVEKEGRSHTCGYNEHTKE